MGISLYIIHRPGEIHEITQKRFRANERGGVFCWWGGLPYFVEKGKKVAEKKLKRTPKV